MRKIILGLAAAAAAVSSPSLAATTGGTMAVKLNVDNSCTLSIGAIDFGTLSDFSTLPSTPLDSVTLLKCTPLAVATVTVSTGLNPNSTQRRMKSKTLTTAAYINYDIVDGSNVAWPTTGKQFTGNGNFVNLGMRGQLPAQAAQPKDDYEDSVTINVAY